MSFKTFEEYFDKIVELEEAKAKKHKEYIESRMKEIKAKQAINEQNNRTREYKSRAKKK